MAQLKEVDEHIRSLANDYKAMKEKAEEPVAVVAAAAETELAVAVESPSPEPSLSPSPSPSPSPRVAKSTGKVVARKSKAAKTKGDKGAKDKKTKQAKSKVADSAAQMAESLRSGGAAALQVGLQHRAVLLFGLCAAGIYWFGEYASV